MPRTRRLLPIPKPQRPSDCLIALQTALNVVLSAKLL